MKFSILVVTYRTELNKLLLTLQSAIMQDFDDFEIVVADDASDNNWFAELRTYFADKHFNNYTLVANEKNQGTVKNLISGLEQVSGKYVKFISAGDALYDEHTLQRLYDFMENHACEGCFGLMQGYQLSGKNQVDLYSYCRPFDIDTYKNGGKKERIEKNLVLYSDHVCGAAICYLTSYAKEYMERISPYVVYEEDIFQVLAAIEGRQLQLFEDYIIWYEVGTGSSTTGGQSFLKFLKKDLDNFYQMLQNNYGDNNWVQKRISIKSVDNIKNTYCRAFLRIFLNLDIRYLTTAVIQKIKKSHLPEKDRKGFLQKKEFREMINKNMVQNGETHEE